MGAKTALLVFADGDVRPDLLGATRADRAEVERVVWHVHPGYLVEPDGETTLDDVYPLDDVTNATVLAGAELFCDRRLVLDRPQNCPNISSRSARAGASSCTACTPWSTGCASPSGKTVG